MANMLFIKSPKISRSVALNYEHYFSFILSGDSKVVCRSPFVVVGDYGKHSRGETFSSSNHYSSLEKLREAYIHHFYLNDVEHLPCVLRADDTRVFFQNYRIMYN